EFWEESVRRIDQNISASSKARRRREDRAIQHWHLLPRQHESHRTVLVLEGDAPCLHSLRRVARPEDDHVWYRPEARQLLNRLMGRAVLAQRDAVVGPNVDHVRAAQSRQPD